MGVGTQAECPAGLGPFVVVEYVDHARTVSEALNILGRSDDERPLLDPKIDEGVHEFLYGHMAQILLKLSRPSLPRIGSFSEVDEFEWAETERPVTYNANNVVLLGGVLPDRLPSGTFSTASSYYSALADLHLEHLSAHHNDAVQDEHDCRGEYIARQLFRNLAAEKRLDTFPEYEHGPFKLYCEDLRPECVLLTESNTVAGVVDWEFTISAPASFAYSPPWWLLIERPTGWPWKLDKWEKEYVPRLHTFLDILKRQEDEAIAAGRMTDAERLSNRMRRIWDSGGFWIDYAAQYSFAFDHIYFNRLDERFFGNAEGDWLECRLPLLSEEQRQNMEAFVRMKIAQKDDRRMKDGRFEGLLPEEAILQKCDDANVTEPLLTKEQRQGMEAFVQMQMVQKDGKRMKRREI